MFRSSPGYQTDYTINSRLENIEKQLKSISDKLDKLDEVKTNTDKMKEHIIFINGVYEKVRTPLYWMCDKVNVLRYYPMSESQRLKEKITKIENGNENSFPGNDIRNQD